MCCTRLAENTGRKMTQKIAICAPSHNFVGLCLRNEARIDNRKKLLNRNISSTHLPQYGKLRPTNGWDRFGSLGHPCKFQRVSRLAFVIAPTSLTGGQPNFARCLPVSYAGTLYIHFGGGAFAPWQNFVRCKIHFTSTVQVLRSPILAALLHGTPAAGVSQTSRRGTRNGITDFRKGRHLYSAERPPRWASAHILVYAVSVLVFVSWFTVIDARNKAINVKR